MHLSSKDLKKAIAEVNKLLSGCPEQMAVDALQYAEKQLKEYKSKKIDIKKVVKTLDLPRLLTEDEIEDCVDIRLWLNMSVEPTIAAVEDMKRHLRNELKNIWLYPSQIPEMKQYIYHKYSTSQVQPGEMVGTLAAQAIGEPSTQLTLRTFHSAGIGNAYVNTGIGRILSLLAVSKNDSSARVFFKEEYTPTELYEKINVIKAVRIKHLMDTADPDKTPLQVLHREEDPWWYEYTDPLPEGEFNYYIYIKLSPTALYRYGITMKQIEDVLTSQYGKIPNDSRLLVKRSPDAIATLHVFLESFKFEKEKDSLFNGQLHVNESNVAYYFMRDKLSDVVKNVVITGIDEIEEVAISKSGETWVMDTKGCNLSDLFANELVDFKRTMSSSVPDNFEMLGIEAARTQLLMEFKHVFDANGVSVAQQVVELLADSMTSSGRPLPVSRYSMGTSQASNVIQQATFEKSDESFYEAAINGMVDSCDGVSASILVGKPMVGGTGLPELYVNKNREKELLQQACELFGVDDPSEINTKVALMTKQSQSDVVDIVEFEE